MPKMTTVEGMQKELIEGMYDFFSGIMIQFSDDDEVAFALAKKMLENGTVTNDDHVEPERDPAELCRCIIYAGLTNIWYESFGDITGENVGEEEAKKK